MDEQFIGEVESVLKHWRHAEVLVRHPALHWPAVRRNRTRQGSAVEALRELLEHGCTLVAPAQPQGAALIRQRYRDGDGVERVYATLHLTEAGFHRLRKRMLVELAIVLAKENQRAERQLDGAQQFAQPLPVVGFDALAASIVVRLRDPQAAPIIVLAGMGGLGKTTLARMVAQALADDETFNGVLWASAKQVEFNQWSGKQRALPEPLTSTDDLVRALARQLHIDVLGDALAIQHEVVAHCHRSPSLVVFDNLETVHDLTMLTPLLGELAGPSRIVITSREHVRDALPTFPAHLLITLDELDVGLSRQLLRVAAEHTHAPALAHANDAELGHIYAVTGGNPLALWLVAGQAWGRPWASFIHELQAATPGSKGEALYTYLYRRSWEQLGPNARDVLFAMLRCIGGAPDDLLWHMSELDRPAFNAAVDELATRMLLVWDGVYCMHQLTYTFLRTDIVGWW